MILNLFVSVFVTIFLIIFEKCSKIKIFVFQLNEISVIQNVGSNMTNGLLGFGGYAGNLPLALEMKPVSPTSEKQMSPPRHRNTPPLWDLHYERKPAGGDERMECQSPPSHVPPRGEGLAA